ncbi:MAG: hypothetical protein NUV98_05650 [Candidatus Roizmanbacteria bacterium]|nr:hypothetical protein [Candidatus Roizmanbacteria bacterium]
METNNRPTYSQAWFVEDDSVSDVAIGVNGESSEMPRHASVDYASLAIEADTEGAMVSEEARQILDQGGVIQIVTEVQKS